MKNKKQNDDWFGEHPELWGLVCGIGVLLLALLAAMMKI